MLGKKRNKPKEKDDENNDGDNQLRYNLDFLKKDDAKLKDENKKLKDENKIIQDENKEIKEKNEKLEEENTKLKNEISQLKSNNANFKEKDDTKIELIGLKEINEAPYINSILQCFLRTQLLSKYFIREYKPLIMNALSFKYYNLINQIKNKEIEISNIEFKDCGNDPKDFIIKFLGIMHQELKTNENNSIISDIFRGETELINIDLSKLNKSNKLGRILSNFEHIDFDMNSIINNNHDIENIENNMKIELNKCFKSWRINNMNSNNQEIKNIFRIKTCPKVLILIFQRNDNDNIKLKFEEKFDITNYTNFNKSFFPEEIKNENIIYKLYGIITKVKNENHYVAFCNNYDENIWYKYDDNKEIKQMNNFKEIVDYEIPLILFYILKG